MLVVSSVDLGWAHDSTLWMFQVACCSDEKMATTQAAFFELAANDGLSRAGPCVSLLVFRQFGY